MFVRELHIVEDALGEKWINIPALLDVIAGVQQEVIRLAYFRGTPEAESVAKVVTQYSQDLRLSLLKL